MWHSWNLIVLEPSLIAGIIYINIPNFYYTLQILENLGPDRGKLKACFVFIHAKVDEPDLIRVQELLWGGDFDYFARAR